LQVEQLGRRADQASLDCGAYQEDRPRGAVVGAVGVVLPRGQPPRNSLYPVSISRAGTGTRFSAELDLICRGTVGTRRDVLQAGAALVGQDGAALDKAQQQPGPFSARQSRCS
jgi:hypothetical protein